MQDSGIVKICALKNMAGPGMMPKMQLVLRRRAYYSEMSVGYKRLYAAKGANEEADALIRAYSVEIPEDCEYCVLDDGKQFRIEAKQRHPEEDAFDLTLERVGSNYDVAGEA